MAPTHPGWTVLVVLLVVATSPVAATQVAPVSGGPAASTDHEVGATGTLLDDPTNATDGATNNTTDSTTDTVDETTTATTTVSTTSTETTTTTVSTTTTTVSTTTTTTRTTDSVDTTGESVENTTEEAVDATAETADAGIPTTSTGSYDGSSLTEDTGETPTDTATGTIESTADDLEAESSATVETTLSASSLTDISTLTDATTFDETVESIGDTEETTDDVDSVLVGDDGSLEQASDSDSVSGILAAATSTASDDGSGAGGAGGDGGGSDDGGGADSVDAETSVSVEPSSQLETSADRWLETAWRSLDGHVPEDAPIGPVGATGVGALAVLAVASRQWFVQAAGTGMPTVLSSGLSGPADGWVEKLKRLALLLRYSRYDDSDPLEHGTRRVLHDAIETTPGIHLTRLTEQVDVPLSTARHHVRVLADENLVTTAKRHGKRRYYPAGVDDVVLSDALSEPARAAVLHALAHHGDAHVGLLADELDRDPSTVTHHLQALADDGLVERERNGRTVVNRLSDAAESTLRGDTDGARDRAELPADD